MEFTLLWAALTAVAMGWLGLRIWGRRVPEHSFDRLLGATATGLVAGRLTAMIVQGVNPITSPADILIVRGGVDTGVAAVVFTATLLWATRSSPHAVDALAPATLLAVAGWHAGCLWRGACLGTVSELPWAWGLPGSGVTRHPVEIYAAVALGGAAWLVSRLGWRPWLRAGAALAAVSLTRLGTEPLRPTITGGPVGWYLIGAGLGLIVMVTGPRLTGARRGSPT